MVKVIIGDLFESHAQTLVNTVNCVGVMGKGVALEFRKRFPAMFRDYVGRCQRGEVRLGQPYLYKSLAPPWILNFPTKDHWRSVTKLDDIIRGFEYLMQHYRQWGITSLAVPPLGCGQGQLEWRVVGPTLYRYLKHLDIPVELYAPYGTPHEEMLPEFFETDLPGPQALPTMPKPAYIQPAWVALVEILKRIEEQPYHWPVGRTTFQKIAYIATEEGLPTGLKYRQGSYGPFCPDLKGMIARLVNNGLIREQRWGQMLEVKTGSTFKDAQQAYRSDLLAWESMIDRTADLFMRLHTRQAEIVSTVIFAERTLRRSGRDSLSEMDVLDYVMQWKKRRKPPLDERGVAGAIRNLAALEWLQVKASPDLPLEEEDLLGV